MNITDNARKKSKNNHIENEYESIHPLYIYTQFIQGVRDMPHSAIVELLQEKGLESYRRFMLGLSEWLAYECSLSETVLNVDHYKSIKLLWHMFTFEKMELTRVSEKSLSFVQILNIVSTFIFFQSVTSMTKYKNAAWLCLERLRLTTGKKDYKIIKNLENNVKQLYSLKCLSSRNLEQNCIYKRWMQEAHKKYPIYFNTNDELSTKTIYNVVQELLSPEIMDMEMKIPFLAEANSEAQFNTFDTESYFISKFYLNQTQGLESSVTNSSSSSGSSSSSSSNRSSNNNNSCHDHDNEEEEEHKTNSNNNNNNNNIVSSNLFNNEESQEESQIPITSIHVGGSDGERDVLTFQIDRQNIIPSFLSKLRHHQSCLWLNEFEITLGPLENIVTDRGGVTSECTRLFFEQIQKQCYEYPYFRMDNDSGLVLFCRPSANVPSDQSDKFYQDFFHIGQLFAISVWHGNLIPMKLPVVIWKQILGQPFTFVDYAKQFPSDVKHLKSMDKYTNKLFESLDLTFTFTVPTVVQTSKSSTSSSTESLFNENPTWVPSKNDESFLCTEYDERNEKPKSITRENLSWFKDLFAKMKLDANYNPSVYYFLRGIWSIIPIEIMWALDSKFLQSMCCGVTKLKASSVVSRLIFNGFNVIKNQDNKGDLTATADAADGDSASDDDDDTTAAAAAAADNGNGNNNNNNDDDDKLIKEIEMFQNYKYLQFAFTNIIKNRMTQEQLGKFIMFVTAQSTIPSSIISIDDWNIDVTLDLTASKTSLPTSSSCYKLIKIPPYNTEDDLYDKLMIAIKWGEGFGNQ